MQDKPAHQAGPPVLEGELYRLGFREPEIVNRAVSTGHLIPEVVEG